MGACGAKRRHPLRRSSATLLPSRAEGVLRRYGYDGPKVLRGRWFALWASYTWSLNGLGNV